MKLLITENEKSGQEIEKLTNYVNQKSSSPAQQLTKDIQQLSQVQDQNQQLSSQLQIYKKESDVWKLRSQELEEYILQIKGVVPKFKAPADKPQSQASTA